MKKVLILSLITLLLFIVLIPIQDINGINYDDVAISEIDAKNHPQQTTCYDESGMVVLAFGACCVKGGTVCVANDCPAGTEIGNESPCSSSKS